MFLDNHQKLDLINEKANDVQGAAKTAQTDGKKMAKIKKYTEK